MASISSIHTLSELSARQSEEAIARLGKANQNFTKAQEKLRILQEYQQTYAIRLQQDMANGLDISHYSNYVGFLTSLEKAVAQQRHEVAVSQYLVEQQRLEWQQCERKRLSFETLKTRAHTRQVRIDNQREQKLNDEFAERSKRVML